MMEGCIEVILQDHTSRWNLTLMIGLAFAGVSMGFGPCSVCLGLRVLFRLKMGVLEEKLLKDLPEDARLIVPRFLFPRWPHSCTAGSGLNQVWVNTAED
ncbi:hypothetical protein E1301_Tti000101 [Triplophysa tibetana]|uniref:Uncharacterized protein n=1 Tax=Triplophysa tibetana TaxID=1572043 RepID=A0A5A9N4X2_9TELE|nr:hypothetical protein E1301_Tti000101 [Triplophysa tibetana]